MYRPLYYAARDNTCNIRRSLSITKALDFIKKWYCILSYDVLQCEYGDYSLFYEKYKDNFVLY